MDGRGRVEIVDVNLHYPIYYYILLVTRCIERLLYLCY